jgi:hypothetical protein
MAITPQKRQAQFQADSTQQVGSEKPSTFLFAGRND